MARTHRHDHPYAFATEGDFNQQLYEALRKSPWWMISISLHVLVGGIFFLFSMSEPAPEPAVTIQTQLNGDVLVEDPEEDVDEHEDIVDQQLVTETPLLTQETEVLDSTDNDLNLDQIYAESKGPSDAPFEGPADNSLIGIQGNAGGAFGRGGGNKDGRRGGRRSKAEDDAVEDALRWLAAHQSPHGGWEAAGFVNWCDLAPADKSRRPDGAGKSMYDAGVTGLALCAFLGAGYTNRGDHAFAKTLSRGLRYLKNIQDPEGCFGPRSTQQYIYNHATAALAMVEAYGMTGSPIFKGPAQRALEFIALTRNPYFAWRYGIKPGDNDTSVTGWMMMAIKSAKMVNAHAVKRGRAAPLSIDEDAFKGIREWLDKVTDPHTGRVGYLTRGTGPARPHELLDAFPADKSESMTAAGVLARVFMGDDPSKSDMIRKGADLCANLPPTWNESDGSIDMYYWYYATLAMYQVGGRHWDKWKAGMDDAMVPTQRRDTTYCEYKGSWDPIGPWGADGGRVYSTAVMALCLQVKYRYGKVFGIGK